MALPERAVPPRAGFRREPPGSGEQRVAAERPSKPACQAGAGFTAGMQSNAALFLGEADGPSNARQAFSEDPTRAPGRGAAKATDLEIEMADPTLPGTIPEMANISAVSPACTAPAQETECCSGASMNRYEHANGVDDYLLNRKAGWEQGQLRIGYGEVGFL